MNKSTLQQQSVRRIEESKNAILDHMEQVDKALNAFRQLNEMHADLKPDAISTLTFTLGQLDYLGKNVVELLRCAGELRATLLLSEPTMVLVRKKA